MSDDPNWFRPKRYGYGAGLPLKWQGWALMTITIGVIGMAVFLFRDRPLIIASLAIPVAIICSVIAAKTTRGGWRWRWGDKDQ